MYAQVGTRKTPKTYNFQAFLNQWSVCKVGFILEVTLIYIRGRLLTYLKLREKSLTVMMLLYIFY